MEKFMINGSGCNDSSHVDVTKLDNGNVVVAWDCSLRTSMGGRIIQHVYARTYNAIGDPLCDRFKVSDDLPSTNNYYLPSLKGLADNKFVIVWNGVPQSSSTQTYLYYRYYDSNGNPLSSSASVSDADGNKEGYASITRLNDGSHVIAWSSKGNSWDVDRDIYARKFNIAGGAPQTIYKLNIVEAALYVGSNVEAGHSSIKVTSWPFTLGKQQYAQVLALNSGNFAAVWMTYFGIILYPQEYIDEGGDPTMLNNKILTLLTRYDSTFHVKYGLYAMNSPVAGAVLGGTVLGDTGYIPSITVSSKSQDCPLGSHIPVAKLTDGSFVILTPTSNCKNIEIHRYDAGANPVGFVFAVDDSDRGSIWSASVTALDEGFVVSWAGGYGTYVRQYSTAGSPVNSVSNITNSAKEVAIIGLSGADYLVVWTTGDTIYGRVSMVVPPKCGNGQYATLVSTILTIDLPQNGGNTFKIQRLPDNGKLLNKLRSAAAVGDVEETGLFRYVATSTFNKSYFTYTITNNVTALTSIECVVNIATYTYEDIATKEVEMRDNYPQMLALNDGFIAVWMRTINVYDADFFNVNVGYCYDLYGIGCLYRIIYGQLYDAHANSLGDAFQINDIAAYSNWEPHIAKLGDDLLIVTWRTVNHNLYPTMGSDIAGKFYDMAMNAVGEGFIVNDVLYGEQYGGMVASLNTTHYMVVWQYDGDIYARTCGIPGYVSSPSFKVNTVDLTLETNIQGSFTLQDSSATIAQLSLTAGNQEQPAIAALRDGNSVIAWRSNGSGRSEIYALIRDINERVMYQCDGSSGVVDLLKISIDGKDAANPTVTTLSDGNFLITWIQSTNSGYENIYGSIYSGQGKRIGTAFAVIDQNTGVSMPSLAAFDGGFIIVWNGNSGVAGLYGRQYDNNAKPLGPSFQIYNSSGDNPVVVSLGRTAFVVAWGESNGIHTKIIENTAPIPSLPTCGITSPFTTIVTASRVIDLFNGTENAGNTLSIKIKSTPVLGWLFDESGNKIVVNNVYNNSVFQYVAGNISGTDNVTYTVVDSSNTAESTQCLANITVLSNDSYADLNDHQSNDCQYLGSFLPATVFTGVFIEVLNMLL